MSYNPLFSVGRFNTTMRVPAAFSSRTEVFTFAMKFLILRVQVLILVEYLTDGVEGRPSPRGP